MSGEQKAATGIEEIPGTLIEAVYAMEADPFIKEVLGTHTYTKYINGKKDEWNRYRSQVTDWEIGEYLNNF
jgi:glutamine synthetase